MLLSDIPKFLALLAEYFVEKGCHPGPTTSLLADAVKEASPPPALPSASMVKVAQLMDRLPSHPQIVGGVPETAPPQPEPAAAPVVEKKAKVKKHLNYISLADTAELLEVPENRIRRWMNAVGCPLHSFPGDRLGYYFDPDVDIMMLVKQESMLGKKSRVSWSELKKTFNSIKAREAAKKANPTDSAEGSDAAPKAPTPGETSTTDSTPGDRPQIPPTDDTMSLVEAAKELGLGASTVSEIYRKKKLNLTAIKEGKFVRFLRQEIEAVKAVQTRYGKLGRSKSIDWEKTRRRVRAELKRLSASSPAETQTSETL